MSLRYQIICRILLSSVCILVLGGAIAVWQARQAVEKEVDASIHLALQLITLGITDTPVFQQSDDLSRFSALRQTRHLSIQLQKPDGQLIHFAGENQPTNPEEMPPSWFIRLVKGDYPKVEHQLNMQDGKLLTLIIQAQPLDEITEVWQESVAFFASISLLTMLTFLAVNLVFNKSLQSIAVIVDTLRLIETGQYRQQLPPFSTQEFDDIAKAINHMTVELEKTRQENRALTQHSLAIQEEERQRLSQELHDEFGQSLTAIKVMAVTAAHRKADAAKITSTISEICDHLMTVVRSMMQQLHPLVLTELGLKATLEEMVNHWSERNADLRLTIRCSDAVDGLDKNLTIQVFRVIQECLTNVVRHAQAHSVTIDLEKLELPQAYLQLKVQDDGRGCDLQTTSHGFGLLGIKERIKSLDGELQVLSRPGSGMLVNARIPLV
ncbi:sensor histidine kinase [Methylomonas fluvii]|uniref:histidine kinase n=1 Tax=Methylomonas fluvii TaxID=1854564 RepID=A0ABR9DIE3_9GAMM|nr:histidine kinase [Methylomonas fluvii]MBD9362646.1 histidine kinase [Methylomonas fluvii]CAD6875772.1 Putative signal transduction histidine kinase [Methylomonas fluvii]